MVVGEEPDYERVLQSIDQQINEVQRQFEDLKKQKEGYWNKIMGLTSRSYNYEFVRQQIDDKERLMEENRGVLGRLEDQRSRTIRKMVMKDAGGSSNNEPKSVEDWTPPPSSFGSTQYA